MLAENIGRFLREGNDTLLPVFRKKAVLRLRADVNSPVRKIAITPVQGLEFSAAKHSGEHQRKECFVPRFAHCKVDAKWTLSQ